MTGLRGRRALIAKLGMDAHWRGAIVVANALRDAGMEVVYVGHATPAQIAGIARQEDPALIGLSTLSGNHLTEVPAVLDALRQEGMDPAVVVGGAVPPADIVTLLEAGVGAVYPTGSPLPEILADLARLLDQA